MKKFFALFGLAALLTLFTSSCTTVETEEIPFEAEITLEDLMAKMTKATDPTGEYAKSKTYTMRQNVYTERFLDEPKAQQVDVKFQQPDLFNLTTYEDNEPLSAVILNGPNGWSVDYKRRLVVPLDGKQLEQLKILASIATPDSAYLKVYSSAQLAGCSINGKKYYKISCTRQEPNPHTTEIYVGTEDFLPWRWRITLNTGNGQLNYTSIINKYSLRDGVMIPDDTTTIQNGHKQTVKVSHYQLNSPISPNAFQPPLF